MLAVGSIAFSAMDGLDRWYKYWVIQDYDEEEYAQDILQQVYADRTNQSLSWGPLHCDKGGGTNDESTITIESFLMDVEE